MQFVIQSPQFLKQPSKFIKVAWDEIPETRDELARRFDECVGTSLAPQLQGQYWGRSKNLEHTAGRGNGMNGLVVRQNGNDHLNLSRPFNTRISYLKILALSLLREIASAEDNGEHQDNDTIDLQAEVQRFERELIRSALIQTGGRQRQAARLLRTKVTTLNTKIKKYRIQILEEASPKTNLQLIHPAKD